MNQHNESSSKKDVYSLVTDQVIAQMEKGVIPWRRPWVDGGIPQNLISKRPYRGINLWLLAMYGYAQNYFLTYKQVQELGGRVKRDETGHMVIFWKLPDTQTEDLPEEEQTKKPAVLRYYMVFNISQCENIPEDKLPQVADHNYQPLLECEMIIHEMPNPPIIQNKENEAYYHPGKDYINMPKRKVFNSNEEYYAVLFHELIHSTGHSSRVGRIGVQQMTPYGSDVYSTEEIIAEMGSCYLTSFAGIAPKPLVNSVAYIQGWLEKLKHDKKVLIYAASQAQKAADYILITPGQAAKNDLIADEAMVG
jgi:antirestriction protein ArdC